MGGFEKLVFETSLEGLFIRGIGDRVTWQLKAELRTLGIDLDRKLPRSRSMTWATRRGSSSARSSAWSPGREAVTWW
jgi:uncharacterized protein (TIGR02265 family)